MQTNRHIKRQRWMRGVVAGVITSMMLVGATAIAEEGFAMLAGLPAQALSPSEMAAVEGKAGPQDRPTFIPFDYWPYLRKLRRSGALGESEILTSRRLLLPR